MLGQSAGAHSCGGSVTLVGGELTGLLARLAVRPLEGSLLGQGSGSAGKSEKGCKHVRCRMWAKVGRVI